MLTHFSISLIAVENSALVQLFVRKNNGGIRN